MSSEYYDCDVTAVVSAILAFALPLTLLVPDFSVWNVVPKVHVYRYHAINHIVTWAQMNAVLIFLMSLFFCLFLEIRKRLLDDMVEKVMAVSQATNTAMKEEQLRQTSAMRVCVEALDASAEHFENIVLLRDGLRKRAHPKQQPPGIELSSSGVQDERT